MSRTTHAPFGTRLKRFLHVGYHPAMNAFPGTFPYTHLAPGCYDMEKKRNIMCKVPRWDQCLENEEFSKRLAYKNDRILKERTWMKSVNGPGWQDISEARITSGGVFRKSCRFSKQKEFSVPGPGSYGKNHVPHTKMEEKSKEKGFSHSTLSFFERMTCRSDLNFQRSYHLPPNLYKIKSSIDQLLDKKISKRGPYDLFTGPRFPKSVTAKYPERAKFKYILKNDLTHPKNVFKGKFLKCGKDDPITSRFVIIDPAASHIVSTNPGPGHYDPHPTLKVSQSLYPFNSSITDARWTQKIDEIPPPGRYNIETKKYIIGNGFRSDFISKTKRDFHQIQKFSWFE